MLPNELVHTLLSSFLHLFALKTFLFAPIHAVSEVDKIQFIGNVWKLFVLIAYFCLVTSIIFATFRFHSTATELVGSRANLKVILYFHFQMSFLLGTISYLNPSSIKLLQCQQ